MTYKLLNIFISTCRYVERTKDETTNVYKEFTKIISKKQEAWPPLAVLPILFLGDASIENDCIPEQLKDLECLDLRLIDKDDER